MLDAEERVLIARGRHSRLYRVVDAATGEVMALKQTPLTRISPGMAVQGRIAHPAVVPIVAAWQADGQHYQLMPLYPANARQQPPAPAQASSAIEALAAGLAAVHAHGWVQGEIKPENILVSASRSYHLTDFDLAAPIGSVMRQSPSPLYAAPEQLSGQPVSAATDLYALGLLLYEWLVGAHPWAALSAKAALIAQLVHPLPPLPAPWAHYQPLITHLTHKDSRQRGF